MTLRVALEMTGNPAGAKRAVEETKQSIAGLNTAMGKTANLADAINERLNVKTHANDNYRKADIEAYAAGLDDLRAKYNPLFAAQQAYIKELAGIKNAHKVGAISATEYNAAIARTKKAFAGQVNMLKGSSGAFKLNQQQLMNMQFQMNDMAVMLASGQSPFVLFMQQGMQIGQMFGPGATVSQALKATGSGIMTFLTNPINLAIAGFAVAAGTIPLIWQAFTGPEAQSAQDAIEAHHNFVDGLEDKYDQAAKAAKRYYKEARPESVVTSEAKDHFEGLTKQYEQAMTELSEAIFIKSAQMFPTLIFPEQISEFRELARELDAGKISGKEFQKMLAEIKLDPETKIETRELADHIKDAAENAADLNREMEGSGASFDVLAGKVSARAAATARLLDSLGKQSIGLNKLEMSDPSRGTDLRQSYRREQERIAREQERAAREAERIARQRQNNAWLISDMEREIEALNATGEVREDLLAKLKQEQDIRSAIASLGEHATAQEIEQLTMLIPLRDEALERSKRMEEQMRREEQSTQRLASSLSSVTMHLLKGKNAGDVFGSMLEQMGGRLLQFGFNALLGGGNMGGSILSMLFSANGNVFDQGNVMAFANGGIVNSPTMFPMTSGVGMMGEAGPEAIMPLKRNNQGRLGVEMAGGVSQIAISLGDGLIGQILSQAQGQSLQLIQNATPMIAAQGAKQGVVLAQDSYARTPWVKK